MTINEEELREIIEGELGGEPEGEDWEAYEERIEEELGRRGEFCPVSELIAIIKRYKEYFEKHLDECFQLASNQKTTGKMLFEDLKKLQEELEKSSVVGDR